MAFETNRTINTAIKMIMPVNIIAEFIPKGLNQESFGGVMNFVPNHTDNKIVKMFVRMIR